jgi:hypothetical protein
MAKDLLEGIVDKETGDLLNRKGEHVKRADAGSKKSTGGKGGGVGKGDGQGRDRKVRLTLALLLVACATGALTWSLISISSPSADYRVYDPKDDVAGPDPAQTVKKIEGVETKSSNIILMAPPQ